MPCSTQSFLEELIARVDQLFKLVMGRIESNIYIKDCLLPIRQIFVGVTVITRYMCDRLPSCSAGTARKAIYCHISITDVISGD